MDIVERLRNGGDDDDGVCRPFTTMHDAADEIERLRATLKTIAEGHTGKAMLMLLAQKALEHQRS